MQEFEERPFGPEVSAPILVDPIFWPAFDEAKRVQAELDAYPNPSEDVRLMYMNKLDELWPKLDRPVSVSGQIIMLAAETIDDEYDYLEGAVIVDLEKGTSSPFTESQTQVVEEAACMSQGFKLVEEGRVIFMGEDMGPRYAVKLLFDREITYKLEDEEDELPRICVTECVADIDEVQLDFMADSSAFAELKSREYFEDYTDDLDELLEGCKTPAERLVAIKDVQAAYPHFITTEELETLEQYVDELLGIGEEQTCFRIQMRPDTILFKPMDTLGQAGVYKKRHALVKLCGIEILPSVEVEMTGPLQAELAAQKGRVELRVLVQLIRDDPSRDSDMLALRLRDVQAIESERGYFHRTVMRQKAFGRFWRRVALMLQ